MVKRIAELISSTNSLKFLANKSLLRILLAGALAVVTLFFVLQAIASARSWNGWLIGEWLINYTGGFTRRGLAGQLILGLHTWTGIGLNWVVLSVQIALWLAVVAQIWVLINGKMLFSRLIAIVSPGALLFYVMDGGSVGRKDLLILVLLLSWVRVLPNAVRPNTSGGWVPAIFGALATFVMLCHESMAFYLGYFLVSAWIISRSLSKAIRLTWPIAAGVTAAGLVESAFGAQINSAEICRGLVSEGALPSVCHGAIDWPYQSILSSFQYVTGLYSGLTALAVLLIIIATMWLWVLASAGANDVEVRPRVLAGLAMAMLGSTPLYLLGLDWGRWTHMNIMLGIITIIASDNFSPRESGHEYQSLPGIKTSRALVILCLIAFFLTSSVWKMSHCCQPGFQEFSLGGILSFVAERFHF